MKTYVPAAIRNVGLFGHGGAGKTSLVEALLFRTGAVNRLGRVDDGSATTDYDPDEVKRKMSVSAALAPLEWNETKINLVDAPGYADFMGEVIEAMRVVETAVVVVDAVAGVQVGTDAAWRAADRNELPRMVFVNKMERENADFDRVIEQLRGKHGTGVVALTVPIGDGGTFTGVANVVSRQALLDDKAEPSAVPADAEANVARYREMLMESIAELDDDLLNKYLEEGELSEDEIREGIRRGIAERKLNPVLTGSALQEHGIRFFLDALVDYAPAAEAAPVRAQNGSAGDGTAALVFKTVSDPFIGRLSFLRSYAGEVHSDSHLWNPNHNKDERIGQVFLMRGKHQEPMPAIGPGDMGVVAKLADTHTGDTLTHKDHPIILDPPHFPEPSYAVSIQPKSKGDLEKLSPSLNRMIEEDPSLSVHR